MQYDFPIMRATITRARQLANNHKDRDLCDLLKNVYSFLLEKQQEAENGTGIAERIGNCYIPHLNRTENDFEQGYNSAIRDVLDILCKNRYNSNESEVRSHE